MAKSERDQDAQLSPSLGNANQRQKELEQAQAEYDASVQAADQAAMDFNLNYSEPDLWKSQLDAKVDTEQSQELLEDQLKTAKKNYEIALKYIPREAEIENTKLEDIYKDVNDSYDQYAAQFDRCEEGRTAVDDANTKYEGWKSLMLLYNGNGYYDKNPTHRSDHQKYKDEAKTELEEAKTKLSALEAECEIAKSAYETYTEILSVKKGQMEAVRETDEDYVTYSAQISCSYGMRSSVLITHSSEGVFIAGAPQMTVENNKQINDVINFGACFSPENGTTHEAAEEIIAKGLALGKENETGYVTKLIDFMTGNEEIKPTKLMLSNSPGICFPYPLLLSVPWTMGKDGVEINGKKPLLRRCEMRCCYGGRIILETSGQPEE